MVGYHDRRDPGNPGQFTCLPPSQSNGLRRLRKRLRRLRRKLMALLARLRRRLRRVRRRLRRALPRHPLLPPEMHASSSGSRSLIKLSIPDSSSKPRGWLFLCKSVFMSWLVLVERFSGVQSSYWPGKVLAWRQTGAGDVSRERLHPVRGRVCISGTTANYRQ